MNILVIALTLAVAFLAGAALHWRRRASKASKEARTLENNLYVCLALLSEESWEVVETRFVSEERWPADEPPANMLGLKNLPVLLDLPLPAIHSILVRRGAKPGNFVSFQAFRTPTNPLNLTQCLLCTIDG